MAGPTRFKLSLKAIKAVEKAVDKLFDRAKARTLGPQSVDKRIYIGINPELSLPGIFAQAAIEERNRPDHDLLHGLMSIAESFIEAQRASTKAKVVKTVTSTLSQAYAQGIDTDLTTVLGGQLATVWEQATAGMKRIIETEATNVRNVGVLDGIVKANIASNVEDPTVFFIVVRDKHLCEECERLHMMEDGITPRLWYLSEVQHGYHKRGDNFPSLGGEHPNCRCTLSTLMPGYGFDDKGFVSYIREGYIAIEEQRGNITVEKSESLAKGAMRRLYPYRPQDDKRLDSVAGEEMNPWTMRSRDVTQKQAASSLQGGYGNNTRYRHMLVDSEVNPEIYARTIHRLHGLTQVRQGADGPEFLLHRGMARDEHNDFVHDGNYHSPDDPSSWSTSPEAARRHLPSSGALVSAWVPQKAIHSMPMMFGDVTRSQPGKNELRHELEVVARPGSFPIHEAVYAPPMKD